MPTEADHHGETKHPGIVGPSSDDAETAPSPEGLNARTPSYHEAAAEPGITFPAVEPDPDDAPAVSARRLSQFGTPGKAAGLGPRKLSPRMKQFMTRWDVNNDGELDEDEIVAAIRSEAKQAHKVANLQIFLGVAVGLLAISIAANFGTSFYAFKAAADTEVGNDGVLMTKNNGNPHIVQVGVADLSTAPATHVGIGGAVPSELLTNPSTNSAIRVLTETEALPSTLISSELPDTDFDELTMLKIKGPHGSINFLVQGYARYAAAGTSRCGSVVVVYTGQGHVQFDGVAMTFSESVAGAFSRAGFATTARRRGRRSSDADAHALLGVREVLGKFNVLSNLALNTSLLSCGDDRPSVQPFFPMGLEAPEDIAYVEHILIPCSFDDYHPEHNQLEECPDEDLDNNGIADHVVDFQGRKYFRRIRSTRARLVGGVYHSISKVTFPELDGGWALIEMTNETHVVRYTLNPGSDVELPNPQFCDAGVAAELGRATGGRDLTVDDARVWIVNVTDEDVCLPPNPTIDFVGYDVLDGVYVRHFKIVDPSHIDCVTNEPVREVTSDYFEHYDERRMFAFPISGSGGLGPPGRIETYESIVTGANVSDSLLQGPGFPRFDDLAAFMAKPAGCELTDPARDLNLAYYMEEAFDWEFFDEDVQEELDYRARDDIDAAQIADLTAQLDVATPAGQGQPDPPLIVNSSFDVLGTPEFAKFVEPLNFTSPFPGAGASVAEIIEWQDELAAAISLHEATVDLNKTSSTTGSNASGTGDGNVTDAAAGGGRRHSRDVGGAEIATQGPGAEVGVASTANEEKARPRRYGFGRECAACRTGAGANECDAGLVCQHLADKYDVLPGCSAQKLQIVRGDGGLTGFGAIFGHAVPVAQRTPGGPYSTTGYCVDPGKGVPVSQTKLTRYSDWSGNLRKCESNCYEDSDCGGALVCHRRYLLTGYGLLQQIRNGAPWTNSGYSRQSLQNILEEAYMSPEQVAEYFSIIDGAGSELDESSVEDRKILGYVYALELVVEDLTAPIVDGQRQHDPLTYTGCVGTLQEHKHYCAAPLVGEGAELNDLAGKDVRLQFNVNPSGNWYSAPRASTPVGPPSYCITKESEPFLGGHCTITGMTCPVPQIPLWTSLRLECGGTIVNKGGVKLTVTGAADLLVGAPWVKDAGEQPEPTFQIGIEIGGKLSVPIAGLEIEILLRGQFEAVSGNAEISVALAFTKDGFKLTGKATLKYDDVFGLRDGKGNKFYQRPTAAEITGSVKFPTIRCDRHGLGARILIGIATLGISEAVCGLSGQTLNFGTWKIPLTPKVRRMRRRLDRRNRRGRMAREAQDAEELAAARHGRRRRTEMEGPKPKKVDVQHP